MKFSQFGMDPNRNPATNFAPPMNFQPVISCHPNFYSEKFVGGCVVSHHGLSAWTWMTRLYRNPGGNNF